MKIEKTVNVDVDVEIDITVEDIRCAIEEDRSSANGVIRTMNDFCRFLKAVPDSLIAEIGEKPRKELFEFLSEQLERFDVGNAVQICSKCGRAVKITVNDIHSPDNFVPCVCDAPAIDEMCKNAVDYVIVNQLIDTICKNNELIGWDTYPEKMMAIAGYIEGKKSFLRNLVNN